MAITPLNFWVQPVIPLTFDDSISYLEALGKVVEKLNEALTQNEDWATALRKDITDFTTKIENEMTAFKAETNADISSLENRISAQISTFEQQMNDKYSTFKNEIQTLVNSISLNPDYSIDHDSLNMWDVWGSGAKLNYKLKNTTGAEVYSNGNYISAYIPVRPLKKYAIRFGKPYGHTILDDTQYIIVYDENKNYVTQLISGNSPTTFRMPANGYYIRINVNLNTNRSQTISITNLTEDTGMVDIETLPVVNGEPDYSWFSAPESFKTTISSTTTDDNAVYKRKITWRDMDDSRNLALYDNVTVGGYTTGAYNVTTGEFSSSITNSFTSDFIPVCPATDDIVITNPLNATDYANVIYFNENKEMIGMYKFDTLFTSQGLYIRPILYNDVAYIKFSALIADVHNCRVTADGTPNFGSGVYPDTAGFNNVILVTRLAGGIIRCGTKTYTGNECYKILKDCITNNKPIYDSETVSGQLIPLRTRVCMRTGDNETACRYIGNKLNGDSVTLVVSLFDNGSIALS
jgi:hypothetical protein|uniref:Uncharacterized protein n=1 Tax=Podoviridae sp. ctUm43 TaxID=2827738 RepID=A0A8S5SWY1_9CAUD|nr:MAG TPA: hypothetical protein [Podoviridae sp. ctUm43]